MRIKWFSLVRITGLLLVLLYHFFKTTFPGGFVGVDIFFTFSGFLITALLIDEYSRDNTINLNAFYKRRFYRIVPPVILMVLVTMPFTFLVRNDFIANIANQIAAVLGFVTNIYENLIGGNYETQFIPHLFVHMWSLAIEVHFYILWGGIAWLLSKRKLKVQNFRSSLFLISFIFFGLGFLSMFIRAFFVSSYSTIYFSTLSHSFPFFLGCVFATLTGIKDTTARFRINARLWSKKRVLLIAILSMLLLLLLAFVLDFNQLVTYLFGFALSSLFAAMMIYSTRILNDKFPDIKEPFIITYLADISYGLYLFHWPFYIIFSQMTNVNIIAVFLTIILSVFFSTLSFYIIEPFVAGKEVNVFGLELELSPYKKWFYGVSSILVLITVLIAIMAPSMGSFEQDLLVNSLKQSQTSLNQTHTLAAGDAQALSDVTVIGDSVTLRSSQAFADILPDAQVDAAVSRNFTEAYSIFTNHISSDTLSSTIVLAIGVNSLGNYQSDLEQFIDALPSGHRLIIVTPYNSKNDYQVEVVRNYELGLAKKYDYITVADWYQTAVDNPSIWIGSDGVHYSETTEGANLYVTTIKDAIDKSAKSAAKS